MRVYKSYPYCFLIKGNEHSAIFNSQSETIQLVPAVMGEIFEILIGNTSDLSCIQKKLAIDSKTLKMCINHLREKKYIFAADRSDCFPQIEFYDISALNIFKTVVVEFNANSGHMDKIADFINSYPFEFLELRFLPCVTDVEFLLKNFTNKIAYSTIKAIQLVFNNKYEIDLRPKPFGRITHIVKYGASRDSSMQSRSGIITHHIRDEYDLLCSRNNDYNKNLVLDLDYFIQSHFINQYYYGRIEIDSSGAIKNSLKMPDNFGNILYDNPYEIFNSKEFQKTWFIKHDMIREVKGSPLRYNMFITNNLYNDETDNVYKFASERSI